VLGWHVVPAGQSGDRASQNSYCPVPEQELWQLTSWYVVVKRTVVCVPQQTSPWLQSAEEAQCTGVPEHDVGPLGDWHVYVGEVWRGLAGGTTQQYSPLRQDVVTAPGQSTPWLEGPESALPSASGPASADASSEPGDRLASGDGPPSLGVDPAEPLPPVSRWLESPLAPALPLEEAPERPLPPEWNPEPPSSPEGVPVPESRSFPVAPLHARTSTSEKNASERNAMRPTTDPVRAKQ